MFFRHPNLQSMWFFRRVSETKKEHLSVPVKGKHKCSMYTDWYSFLLVIKGLNPDQPPFAISKHFSSFFGRLAGWAIWLAKMGLFLLMISRKIRQTAVVRFDSEMQKSSECAKNAGRCRNGAMNFWGKKKAENLEKTRFSAMRWRRKRDLNPRPHA